MKASTRTPQPPRIEPRVRSEQLSAGEHPFRSGDTREGERFEAADFSDAKLDFATFVCCALDRCRFGGATMRGVHFVECDLRSLDAPVFAAPRSSWRNVEVTASRLGSAELYESSFRSVVIADTKINYLNARSATWTDVVFRDCVIEELDLGHASVTRMDLRDCLVGTLDLTGARLSQVDLRTAGLSHLKGLTGLAGAWVSGDQLTRLAPLLAAQLKINVG